MVRPGFEKKLGKELTRGGERAIKRLRRCGTEVPVAGTRLRGRPATRRFFFCSLKNRLLTECFEWGNLKNRPGVGRRTGGSDSGFEKKSEAQKKLLTSLAERTNFPLLHRLKGNRMALRKKFRGTKKKLLTSRTGGSKFPLRR